MNANHPIADLLTTENLASQGVIQVAEELLQAAVERFSLVLETIPTATGEKALYFVGEPPVHIPMTRPSLFRTILARIASVGSTETGMTVNPYGDHFTLLRSTTTGPVRLEVDFENTPSLQRLRVLRVPAPVTQNSTIGV